MPTGKACCWPCATCSERAAGGAGAAAGGVGAAAAAAGAGFATQRWHKPAPPFRRRTAYLLQARPQRVHLADAGAFA